MTTSTPNRNELADAAGTQLRLFLVEPVVDLTADADPKRCFEEQKHQAGCTDDQVDGAYDMLDHNQIQHPHR